MSYLIKQKKREENDRLIRYNESLKEKLAQHQQVKYQELQQKMEQARKEQIRVIEKEK